MKGLPHMNEAALFLLVYFSYCTTTILAFISSDVPFTFT